ncbi:hypothetical protein AAHA92_06078 [Salvia divinorum]|uniref:Uncharacterized protein n=1 Tax=Salvia divinorum TaxID=28513 RepID=A0ABD1I4J5_SALDI
MVGVSDSEINIEEPVVLITNLQDDGYKNATKLLTSSMEKSTSSLVKQSSSIVNRTSSKVKRLLCFNGGKHSTDGKVVQWCGVCLWRRRDFL